MSVTKLNERGKVDLFHFVILQSVGTATLPETEAHFLPAQIISDFLPFYKV